eukprot:CAMPEP_0172446972 /NCGR_PEP_ID=MMETSP1065-20121228/6388_1 /TAXON_ID=265537 /ORGANISM="Amphiprora paludosa, Strain CCMP125" /LENGTH=180 /DNA_ID=CAMNT_0013198161 /DNA_START=44 /DNA_END=586 /DNA_ORIENTATION=+
MSVAEWDNEYARLARAASQLRSGVGVVGDASSLRAELQRLQTNLESLPLQPTEIQRRRRLIQHLTETSGGGDVTTGTGTSNSQVQSQMQRAMQQQDAMIDELAVGMGRLKHQSQAIQEESNMHVNLLNDMEQNLDSAQQGLESETRRAVRLKEDQSVWRLQLTVAGLTVLLVMLILLGLS